MKTRAVFSTPLLALVSTAAFAAAAVCTPPCGAPIAPPPCQDLPTMQDMAECAADYCADPKHRNDSSCNNIKAYCKKPENQNHDYCVRFAEKGIKSPVKKSSSKQGEQSNMSANDHNSFERFVGKDVPGDDGDGDITPKLEGGAPSKLIH